MIKKYYLAEACQNSFVIFDNLFSKELTSEDLLQSHEILLKENRDDALILVDGYKRDGDFYFTILLLGVDGEFGDFCGNGARACAAYLYQNYPQFHRFYIKQQNKNYALECISPEYYCTELALPAFLPNPRFIADASLFILENNFYFYSFSGYNFYYVEIIEPHLIIKDELSVEELTSLGRKLNANKDLFPKGMNLTSYKIIADNELFALTYERGVQRLTLSCGTGAAAAALCYLQGKSDAIKVHNRGGKLEISCQRNKILLCGQAQVTQNIECF